MTFSEVGYSTAPVFLCLQYFCCTVARFLTRAVSYPCHNNAMFLYKGQQEKLIARSSTDVHFKLCFSKSHEGR